MSLNDTAIQFINDYKPFIDKFGLVQPESDGRTSQNGVRFTSECILAIDYHFRSQMPLVMQAFLDERVTAIHACQLMPGLIRRAPDSTEQIGPDDMLAACAVGYLFSPKLANDIYKYAKATCYVFNTENPGKFTFSAWIGRHPAWRAFIKYCATGEISFFGQLSVATGILFSARDTSQDGKMLAWFMIRVFSGKGYSIIDAAVKHWQKKLHDHYGDGGIGEVLGRYFSPAHYTHPSSKWLRGVNR